ncbi:MAG: hypothetical protein JXB13_00750 [Phycisphaerae bacterium]|nr:hypothetical protein [Phycisphaerae bacterium]
MAKSSLRSRKFRIVGVLVALAVTGTSWGLWRHSTAQRESTLPPELSADALRKEPMDPARMRSLMEGDTLSEEQRRELWHNMAEARQAQFSERMQEYFKAPKDQRAAVLDRHIDEMLERMRQRAANRPPAGGAPGAGQREPEQAERRREGMRSSTPAQRKSRSESRNPDDQAQRMAYMAAMRERMKERGIQPPAGGRGGVGGGFGGGGFGGGPGGAPPEGPRPGGRG